MLHFLEQMNNILTMFMKKHYKPEDCVPSLLTYSIPTLQRFNGTHFIRPYVQNYDTSHRGQHNGHTHTHKKKEKKKDIFFPTKRKGRSQLMDHNVCMSNFLRAVNMCGCLFS